MWWHASLDVTMTMLCAHANHKPPKLATGMHIPVVPAQFALQGLATGHWSLCLTPSACTKWVGFLSLVDQSDNSTAQVCLHNGADTCRPQKDGDVLEGTAS